MSLNDGVGAYYARDSFTGDDRLTKTLDAIPEKPVDIVSGPEWSFFVDIVDGTFVDSFNLELSCTKFPTC